MTDEEQHRLDHPGVLRLYDISMDEFRDVTQADVDQMMRKLTELMAPTITPREVEPTEVTPRIYVGEITDRGRAAHIEILVS